MYLQDTFRELTTCWCWRHTYEYICACLGNHYM